MAQKRRPLDLADDIIAHETGELSAEDTLRLFGDLVRTGLAWQLQGHYGRTAVALIDNGYLDRQGNILREVESD